MALGQTMTPKAILGLLTHADFFIKVKSTRVPEILKYLQALPFRGKSYICTLTRNVVEARLINEYIDNADKNK